MKKSNVKLKFKFEAESGTRLMRYFWAVTVLEKNENGKRLWWNNDMRLWETLDTHKDCAYSTHAECKTFKSFKRMLRKHPHIVGKCVLVSNYIGYNIDSIV